MYNMMTQMPILVGLSFGQGSPPLEDGLGVRRGDAKRVNIQPDPAISIGFLDYGRVSAA